MPGMTVSPLASITVASRGTSPFRLTATILSSSMASVTPGIGSAPVPSLSVPQRTIVVMLANLSPNVPDYRERGSVELRLALLEERLHRFAGLAGSIRLGQGVEAVGDSASLVGVAPVDDQLLLEPHRRRRGLADRIDQLEGLRLESVRRRHAIDHA